MGVSIVARKRKDGTVSYTAQVRIKSAGVVIFSESRTFETRRRAETWGRRRDDELQSDPAALQRVQQRGVTVEQLIERYRSSREPVEPFGRTKSEALDQLARQPIAAADALALDQRAIVEHILVRRKTVSAATALNDINWLRVVFRFARSALGIPVDMQMLDDAAHVCRAERLIAKSKRRTRRPTADELRRMEEWFSRPGRRSWPGREPLPMTLLMWAAIYSTRRLSELCSLRLADYDRAHGVWLVRDVKHPGGAAGNHREMLVPPRFAALVEHAIAVIPRSAEDDRLFPVLGESVGAVWQKTTQLLGIEDLHWHDLRHEGCSRLAEDGMSIPQIQQVSLHESWASLQIYVNLRTRREDRVEWAPPPSAP